MNTHAAPDTHVQHDDPWMSADSMDDCVRPEPGLATIIQGFGHGDLRRGEIDANLERNRVGRLAYLSHDQVDIEPIDYVYQFGWIYGLTSKGAELNALMHRPRVAFEVGEVRGIVDWRSVVIVGNVEFLNPVPMPRMAPDDMAAHEDPSFLQGVSLLRTLLPESLMAGDPAPYRYMPFRIDIHEVSGYSSQASSVA